MGEIQPWKCQSSVFESEHKWNEERVLEIKGLEKILFF